MKRFVIATASALFLLAGTAAASVPVGPGTRSPHSTPISTAANGGPASETEALGLAPLAPWVDPAAQADPALALPGLPGGAMQVLGAVDPALATVTGAVAPITNGVLPALTGALPPAVAGALAPVIAGPAAPALPVPGATPPSSSPPESKAPKAAHPHASANRLSPRAAAAAAASLFQGLPGNGYAAYGTASVIHTDLLQAGDQRIENLDAAFSAASVASAAIPQTTNEMARIISPALAAGNAYGRGSGVEVGLAMGKSDPNQIIPGSVAEAKAPPSTTLITKEVGPVAAPPVLGADLLRGQAQSKANSACTTGTDLSYGLGYAANLGLINSGPGNTLSTAADTPDRSVSQSRSHTFLVPQDGAPNPIRMFGLASETRETIAPVTFFKGQPQQFTLEFAGEWVLRSTADGKTGKVFYGPGNVSPSTPLLHILDKTGAPMSGVPEITTQTLFGPNGLTISLPGGAANLTIGGPPRAIGGASTSKPTETATLAAGAVDVVSVQLLDGAGARLADVRIGHMENATAVPAGGIQCGIGLVKTSDKEIVSPGDTFHWTINVSNPNDCVLTKLKVVDTITADNGIVWTVDSASPTADQLGNGGVTWNDVGPLSPGQSKDLSIGLTVAGNSGGGKFLDNAVATGVCGPAAGTAGADAAVGVPLEAHVSLNLPEVSLVKGAALLPRELPRTGGVLAILPALALTGGGLALRRSKRRKPQTR
jgi:uncharacterized repeat protein (TIGR01451 family)